MGGIFNGIWADVSQCDSVCVVVTVLTSLYKRQAPMHQSRQAPLEVRSSNVMEQTERAENSRRWTEEETHWHQSVGDTVAPF